MDIKFIDFMRCKNFMKSQFTLEINCECHHQETRSTRKKNMIKAWKQLKPTLYFHKECLVKRIKLQEMKYRLSLTVL